MSCLAAGPVPPRARRIPRYAFANLEQEEEMPPLTDATLKETLKTFGEGLVEQVKEELRNELKKMEEKVGTLEQRNTQLTASI